MKTVRVVLSAIAILLAIGAVLASHSGNGTVVPGYEFIDQPGTSNDRCDYKDDCDISGSEPCTFMGEEVQLRDGTDPATSCGNLLWRQ